MAGSFFRNITKHIERWSAQCCPGGIQAIRRAAVIAMGFIASTFDQKLERSNSRMQTISIRVTAATTRRVDHVMPRLTHQSIALPIMTGMRISRRNGRTPAAAQRAPMEPPTPTLTEPLICTHIPVPSTLT